MAAPQNPPQGSTWGIIFRTPLTNPDGTAQPGILLYGAVSVRPQNGWLVFEGATKTPVYTVPTDVIGYAIQMDYAAFHDAVGMLRNKIEGTLRTVKPQGEA